MDSNSAHETDNLSVSFLNFCYNSLMKRHFLLLTFYLFLTGLTAGLVAFILTKAIHLIQSLSFGFSQGSFSTMIASVPPQRRALSLLFAGLLAGLGWHLLAKKERTFNLFSKSFKMTSHLVPGHSFGMVGSN